MRELLSPALPQVRTQLPELPPEPAPGTPQHRPAGDRPKAPLVERIACWSARHRIAVIVGWLVLAATAMLGGHLLGTQSQPQYDPGQSGQAEQMLTRLGVVTPPSESVLIQARSTGPDASYAHDPALRSAVAEVAGALHQLPGAARDVRSPLGPGGQAMISADGRSALVTFQVAGPNARADSTVNADLAAVARVQARHPGLIVAEAGGPAPTRRPTR